MACTSAGRFWLGSCFNLASGLRREKSGESFCQAQAKLRGCQAKRKRRRRHHQTRRQQRRNVPQEDLPGEMRHVFRMQIARGEGQRKERPRRLPEAGEPCRAAGAEQPQKDTELQRGNKFPRGRKLTFVARLFHAPLGSLFGLALIRHGAS